MESKYALMLSVEYMLYTDLSLPWEQGVHLFML
jgi:hypothetical protein